MKIVNLTQHPGTPEQGVVDLTGEALEDLKRLLTFERIPTAREIEATAERIADMAVAAGAQAAMIGGAPYLMAALERALRAEGITPMYSFSARESAEEKQADGTVRKTAVFRHRGWVVVP